MYLFRFDVILWMVIEMKFPGCEIHKMTENTIAATAVLTCCIFVQSAASEPT